MSLDIDKVIANFEEITKNASRVQRETLEKILEDNKKAEYLLKLGLNGRTDPASFKECVPLVSHSDIEPYINRILDGDSSSILTGKPITTLSISSGTTEGRRKYLPFNDELFENTMQIFETSFAYRNKEFPIENGSKSLQFIYTSKPTAAAANTTKITAATATTNIFRHPNFVSRMSSMCSQPITPSSIILSSPPDDFHQSLYCHFLSALLHRHSIQFISSTFAHSLVHAFETFPLIYTDLISDIESNSLNTDHVTDPVLRHAMITSQQQQQGDNSSSSEIREICQELSDKGWDSMVSALFPNVKYLYGILTGSMQPYVKKLRKYAGSKVALIAADYGASEGWIAVNVNPRKEPPESSTFVMVPNIGYFEFLPLPAESSSDQTKVISLTEVEVGKEYEVIVTNFAGLYRYKLGDVVQVVGFYNSSPEIKFIGRKNLILNINIDKTTEKDLYLAVEEAAEKLAGVAELEDFTSRVERSVEPGHYVVFWELRTSSSWKWNDDSVMEAEKSVVLQECCDCMDMAFVDVGYVSARKSGGIGALEMRIVRKGTFQKVMDYYLGLGNTANQFKTPRCIGENNKTVLEILEDSVVKTYISNAYTKLK